MKKNRSLKFTLAIAAGLVVLCVVCLAFGAWFGNTPEGKASATERAGETAVAAAWTPTPPPTQTETPAPTLTPTVTLTPVPTLTPTPLFGQAGDFPTPQPNLYKEVALFHKEMTDLQFNAYRETLVGQRVHLEGKVIEVHADGGVQLALSGDGFLDTLIVEDFPVDMAMQLMKDSQISLDATIQEVGLFVGTLSTTVNNPVIWWIK